MATGKRFPSGPSLPSLLSPTHLLPSTSTVDVYSLRHLILQRGGLPDSPSWIRAQAWSILLGLLGSEKRDWPAEWQRRREEYYLLLEDLLPNETQQGSQYASSSTSSLDPSPFDPLLNQINLDLLRSRYNAFSFFQSVTPPSAACPLAPVPSGWSDEDTPNTPQQNGDATPSLRRARKRSSKRHALLRRLQSLQEQPVAHKKHKAEAKKKPLPTVPQPVEATSDSQSTSTHLKPPGAADVLSRQSSISAGSEDDGFHSAGEEIDAEASPQAHPTDVHPDLDKRSNSLMRILFLYAMLNPSIGYVQGMVEVASVVLWTMGSSTGLPQHTADDPQDTDESFASETPSLLQEGEPATNPHFEADAFWCFSFLLGELRELWDFEGLDHSNAGLSVRNTRIPESVDGNGDGQQPGKRRGEIGGMARALQRLGGRLKWADRELWEALHFRGLSPAMPYYAFRWLATLFSNAMPLPSLVRIWDALLGEPGAQQMDKSIGPSAAGDGLAKTSALGAKVDFLIDILTALLMSHRERLLGILSLPDEGSEDSQGHAAEAFASCMQYLQDLPDEDVGPVLEEATLLRQRRVVANLSGEGGPPDDEDEGESAAQQSQSAIKGRALNAWREWTNAAPSSPSTGVRSQPGPRSVSTSSWFRALQQPGTPGSAHTADLSQFDEVASPNTSIKSTSSALFNKYAQAIQSSDTAAELSKRRTNLTLKALERMEKWNEPTTPGAQDISTPQKRVSSDTFAGRWPSLDGMTASSPASAASGASPWSFRLASVGANIKRNFSGPGTTALAQDFVAEGSAGSMTQTQSPHALGFPLPDVADSPDGRTEYAYQRPASLLIGPSSGRSISISPLAFDAQIRPSERSPRLGHSPHFDSAGSSSADRQSQLLSPPMAHAWSMDRSSISTTSSSQSAASSSGRGPKPLLLASAARAAQPHDDHTPTSSSPKLSKVVRTGPLGGGGSAMHGSASPLTARQRNGSVNGNGLGLNVGRRASLTKSSARSSSTGLDDTGDTTVDSIAADAPGSLSRSSRHASTSSHDDSGGIVNSVKRSPLKDFTSLQTALQTPGALPQLPSLMAAAQAQSATGAGPVRISLSSDGSLSGSASPVISSSSSAAATSIMAPTGLGFAAKKLGTKTAPAGAFGGGAANTASRTAAVSRAAPEEANEKEGRALPSPPVTSGTDSQAKPQRPAFGSIASSSDVPLVSNEGRQIRRRGVGAGGRRSSARSSVSTTGPRSSRVSSSRFSGSGMPENALEIGDDEEMPYQERYQLTDGPPAPLDCDVDDVGDPDETVTESEASVFASDGELKKYALVDEPEEVTVLERPLALGLESPMRSPQAHSRPHSRGSQSGSVRPRILSSGLSSASLMTIQAGQELASPSQDRPDFDTDSQNEGEFSADPFRSPVRARPSSSASSSRLRYSNASSTTPGSSDHRTSSGSSTATRRPRISSKRSYKFQPGEVFTRKEGIEGKDTQMEVEDLISPKASVSSASHRSPLTAIPADTAPPPQRELLPSFSEAASIIPSLSSPSRLHQHPSHHRGPSQASLPASVTTDDGFDSRSQATSYANSSSVSATASPSVSLRTSYDQYYSQLQASSAGEEEERGQRGVGVLPDGSSSSSSSWDRDQTRYGHPQGNINDSDGDGDGHIGRAGAARDEDEPDDAYPSWATAYANGTEDLAG